MTLDSESASPYFDDGDWSLAEILRPWPTLGSLEPWHPRTPETHLLLSVPASGMWQNLRTECCQVDQLQSLEHFGNNVAVAVADMLTLYFWMDFVYWQQMKTFQKVEELPVVDDKHDDIEVEQHCTEDVGQVVEAI